jgi:hypothetical protein
MLSLFRPSSEVVIEGRILKKINQLSFLLALSPYCKLTPWQNSSQGCFLTLRTIWSQFYARFWMKIGYFYLYQKKQYL